MKAVAALREHTGLSQSVFAVKHLGKTLPTQQRYEGVVPPPVDVLLVMVKLAREVGREDLREVFKRAAVETVPEELQQLIKEPAHVHVQKTAAESSLHKRRAITR